MFVISVAPDFVSVPFLLAVLGAVYLIVYVWFYVVAPDDMSVPFLLAVVGGCILFLSILIPTMFFVCRYCCNRAPVGVTEVKPLQLQKVSNISIAMIY